MSKNEDKEEKIRRYRIEQTKYLGKFWNVKQNTLPERMPQKNIYYRKTIKNLVNILLEENAERKERLINLRKKRLKQSSSTETMNYLSPKVIKIINKIDRNIGKIKNSITDITKMNGLFLEKKARKTISTYRNTTKNEENEAIIYNQTQRLNMKHKIKKLHILNDLNNKENKDTKENYMKNFKYVNDNYRKQLNFAFLNYNSEKHIKNLKIIVQAEPLIRRDITTIKKEVDEDIKWRCDKHHFRKKYEMIKKRFQRSKSVQNTPKEQFNKNNILPNLNKKKETKIFTPKFTQNQIVNIFNKKDENAKIIFPKEEKLEEINYMLKASSEIDNLIKDENINKKIDLYRTHYEEKLRLNEFYDTKGFNLLEKDYFEEEKKNVINRLGNIYNFQIDKNIKEKERKIKGKIDKDNDAFNKKINEEKNNVLNNINEIIHDNITKNAQ